MSTNEEAIKILRVEFGNNGLKLPRNVSFILEEDQTRCRIKLNPKKVQTENMQTDANAFEGWAVALHITLAKPGKIILDVDGTFEEKPYETNGHWGRFLYRALRFSQQYGEWFELSEQVESVVKEFEEYLKKEYFTNNIGEGEAGIKESHGGENNKESEFAEDGRLQEILAGFGVGDNKVYRQHPVGLFNVTEDVKAGKKSYHCSSEKEIFTGGKSAIDLWTWNKNEFEVIELKLNNPMMGIVTEIFFYSNYIYDFLIREDGRFILNAPQKETNNDRGYSNILHNRGGFKRVCGIMLADSFHPMLEKPIFLDILNKKSDVDIKYIMASY